MQEDELGSIFEKRVTSDKRMCCSITLENKSEEK
jgi:hypothetical protein